jgi:HEAT repeat protein
MNARRLFTLVTFALCATLAPLTAGTPEDDFNGLVGRVQSALSMDDSHRAMFADIDVQTARRAVAEVMGEMESLITVETMAAIKTKHPDWSNRTALIFALGMGHSPDKAKFKL